MSTSTIRTSPKKARKPQARSLPLRAAIVLIVAEYVRLTVRQLFYQLVARREIDKTEQAYKRVCDVSAQLRLDGSIHYGKIADGHRSRRGVYAHGSMAEALENAAEIYRRNYWLDQPVNVEIWCEKDALTGVIQPVCTEYGVTYVATRGFPSLTLIYESAMAMVQMGKPTHLYYFGDHDASGRAISGNLEVDLRAHGADVTVERVALDPWQIERFNLPTRPGKASDSRHSRFAAAYGDACVELDALPPDILEDYVREAIRSEIDPYVWRKTQEVEELERRTLESIVACDWRPGKVYSLVTGDEEAA